MRAEHVPHVAVAVVRGDGTIVDTVLSSGARAATPGDVFEAASLTKPVFAALVMSLIRDSVIRLDAPLSSYPGWPRMSDPRAGAITIAMVLSHSSGLGNGDADSAKRLAFDPGHGWRYSGAAYRYLQRVVEHATGQPLDTLLRTRVFAPLGMGRSSMVDAARPESAWFVGHDRAGRPLPRDRFVRASASTSLRTTARDYARFLQAVMAGGRDGSPLWRADVAAMLEPRASVDSSLGIRWGLGCTRRPRALPLGIESRVQELCVRRSDESCWVGHAHRRRQRVGACTATRSGGHRTPLCVLAILHASSHGLSGHAPRRSTLRDIHAHCNEADDAQKALLNTTAASVSRDAAVCPLCSAGSRHYLWIELNGMGGRVA